MANNNTYSSQMKAIEKLMGAQEEAEQQRRMASEQSGYMKQIGGLAGGISRALRTPTYSEIRAGLTPQDVSKDIEGSFTRPFEQQEKEQIKQYENLISQYKPMKEYSDLLAAIGKEKTTGDKEKIELSTGLRKEYVKAAGRMQDIEAAYNKVKNASDRASAAGDLSLIFNYMKMLDPGSVVREGEFANAQNAAGIPDRIRNTYNRIVSGERLNINQRKDFIDSAKGVYSAERQVFDPQLNTYKNLANKYNLDQKDILTWTPSQSIEKEKPEVKLNLLSEQTQPKPQEKGIMTRTSDWLGGLFGGGQSATADQIQTPAKLTQPQQMMTPVDYNKLDDKELERLSGLKISN